MSNSKKRKADESPFISAIPSKKSTSYGFQHATTSVEDPTYERKVRPKRWRTSKPNKDEHVPCSSTHQSEPGPQARKKSCTERSKTHQTRLRFSFDASKHADTHKAHIDKALNQSFSGIQLGDSSAQSKTQPETTPILSKPTRKKREGYGFSYSESLFCDSDDYPDTECDWDSSDETVTGHEDTPTPAPKTTTLHDPSFNDIVVVRDVGSFHLARPQRKFPCTKATQQDTIRLKQRAKALVGKYEESGDIQAQLLTRIERMVIKSMTERQRAEDGLNSIVNCVGKLGEFLERIRWERISTGEHRKLVEHEMEWMKWFEDASRTGVLHLKSVVCECAPDWEE